MVSFVLILGVVMLATYCIGSLCSAVIVAQLCHLPDPRSQGSRVIWTEWLVGPRSGGDVAPGCLGDPLLFFGWYACVGFGACIFVVFAAFYIPADTGCFDGYSSVIPAFR